MTRHVILTLLMFPVLPLGSMAQCDSSTVGQYDGTPLTGNENTPFPTNTGSLDRRGFRVQYIYPAGELLAAGVCAGPFTKITFNALLGDAPEILVDIRMAHTSLNHFGPWVANSSTPLSVDWEDVDLAPVCNLDHNAPLDLIAGPVEFAMDPAAFSWDGINNLVIDLSWCRMFINGYSPPVMLEEDLDYTATKWVQVTTGANVLHGNTYDDNPLPLNATTGTTMNRPVTIFHGLATSVESGVGTADLSAVFDPSRSIVLISRTGSGNGTLAITCTDALGRIIALGTLPAGASTLRIPLEQHATGLVLVSALSPKSGSQLLARVMPVW